MVTTMEDLSMRKRLLLLGISIVQISMCSGVMFGWPSLETVLTDYGIYSDLCGPNEELPCNSQKLRYSLVYTVGVFMNTVTPVFIGIFGDKYGPKLTNMMGATLMSISALMFSVSLLFSVPDLIIFSFAIMAGSGPAISLSVFHFSNLFPGYELTIMSTYSGVFTISSLIFPVFKWMYDLGIHLGYSFGIYVLVFLPFALLGYFLFPFDRFPEVQARASDTELLLSAGDAQAEVKRQEVKDAPYKEQVRQLDYWLIIAFLAVQSLRVAMYVGTLNDRFADSSNIYTTVFPIIWPAGIIFIPLIGWMLDKKGHDFTVSVVMVVCILYSSIALIPNDRVQFVTFVLISFANVANWGVVFSFISWRFGFANYGKLLGIVSITVAIFGLLQYLFVYVTVHHLDGDYFIVNLVMTLMMIPLLYAPYYLFKIKT